MYSQLAKALQKTLFEKKYATLLNTKMVKYSKTVRKLVCRTSGVFELPIHILDLQRIYLWLELYEAYLQTSKCNMFRPDNELKDFEVNIMSDLDHKRMSSMLDAALYLQIPDLVQCMHLYIAQWLDSKTPEELTAIFQKDKPIPIPVKPKPYPKAVGRKATSGGEKRK